METNCLSVKTSPCRNLLAPPSPATTQAAASVYSQDDVYSRLANLMEWKQRGWLSDTEFEAAKALLLQAPRP